LSLKLIHIGEH